MSRPAASGRYAQLRPAEANAAERAAAALGRRTRPLLDAARSERGFLVRVGRARSAIAGRGVAELRDELASVARGLRRHGFEREGVARGLALLGRLGRRSPKARELAGCRALLEGGLVEMRGEEGTWATGYAACLAALADVPVHVVTVDEDSARRGAGVLAPLYAAAGVRAASLSPSQAPAERRKSLGADVIYAPSRELVFDYLRDRVAMGARSGELSARIAALRDGPLRLRGLCFAIVACADAVLLDEAAVPLVISGPKDGSEEGEVVSGALELARALRPTVDYDVAAGGKGLELTDRGRRQLERESSRLGGFFAGAERRSEWVCLALQALHHRHRGEHYRVRDGRIELLPPADPAPRELLLLIEAKEELEPSVLRSGAARISQQSFFQRYHHIAGVTATARDCASELELRYGLRLRRLPTAGSPVATETRLRILPDAGTLGCALAARIASLRAAGRRTLVVVRSSARGESLADALEGGGSVQRLLAPQLVLDAEARQAASAAGAVAITTVRAARGVLDALREPSEAGPLHIVVAEALDSPRTRHALTSCSGIGGPEGHEVWVSLEDVLLRGYAPRLAGWLSARRGGSDSRPWRAAATGLFLLAERRSARLQRRARSRLQARERQLSSSLSFAGAAD